MDYKQAYEDLEERHTRFSYLLGIATSMILSPETCVTDQKWWLHAVEEVAYKNNPIPPMPEKK